VRAATVRAMPELADRIRFTERLRLEPIGPGHAKDLWRLHQDEAVAEWHGGRWNLDAAHRNAASFGEAWRTVGVHKWIAMTAEPASCYILSKGSRLSQR
jgi:hypothetical protein